MPRPFHGYNIPIAMQSSYLREYATKNNFQFSLPMVEISRPESFSILNGFLNSKDKDLTDLGMVSLFMLPIFDINKIKKIFLKKKLSNLNLHFALESRIVSVNDLINWIADDVPLMKLSSDFNEFRLNAHI